MPWAPCSQSDILFATWEAWREHKLRVRRSEENAILHQRSSQEQSMLRREVLAKIIPWELLLNVVVPYLLAKCSGPFLVSLHQILVTFSQCLSFDSIWGVAKGSSISWVAKFKRDNKSECKLSKGWSWSYKVIKVLLLAWNWVVTKLQEDKSAPQSTMELYYPWISGPLRVSWNFTKLHQSGRTRQKHTNFLTTGRWANNTQLLLVILRGFAPSKSLLAWPFL